MKKMVFAAQVFGLIVMLPLAVILEMNHGAASTSGSSSASKTIQNKEINGPHFIEKDNELNANKDFSITLETLILTKSF